MSTFSDASLVLVPSGIKNQKVYSIKPTDGSGDLTFSRASNATRVNSSGLVEKVRENLITYSQDFSNAAWTKSNATVTGGQSGYDGTTNAWLLTDDATSGAHSVVQFSRWVSSLQTGSVYVKAGTNTKAYIGNASTGRGAFFNLSTGTVEGIIGTIVTQSIVSVGSGWYRISLTLESAGTFTIGSYQTFVGGNFNSTVNYSGSGSTIVVQAAQLEAGDIATDYIATTSTAVSVGPVSGLPRLDYSGGASCPSLKLEPQRTNLNIFSEDFTNATWDKLDLITTNYANVVVSPDGYTNADKLIPNTTSAQYHGVQLGSGRPSLTGGTVYTYSIFAKAQGYDKIRIQNFSAGIRAQFNLTTGTLINQNGTTSTFITPYGNGWYRIGFTYTQSTTQSSYWNVLVVSTDDNSGSAPVAFAGNGTDAIAVWGSTIEAGAYPSSYVNTLSSAVTRVADSASKTGISSLIGQTEGTVFVEVDYSTLSGLDMFLSIRPNASNKVEVYRDGGTIYGEITASSSFALSASKAIGTHKIAFAYKSGSSALYIDGVLAGQSTTAFTYSATLADLFINQRSGGTFIEAANYNQALLFKTRLSNADLETLTTL